jgi:hypothetical protein
MRHKWQNVQIGRYLRLRSEVLTQSISDPASYWLIGTFWLSVLFKKLLQVFLCWGRRILYISNV